MIVKVTTDHVFAIRLNNLFVIRVGCRPERILPNGRRIKKGILQERADAKARADI